MDKKEIELKKEDFKTTIDEPNKESSEVKEEIKETSKNKVKTKKDKRTKRRVIVSIFTIICLIIAFIMYRGNYLEVLEIGDKYVSAYQANVKYKVLTIAVSF